MSLYLLDRRSWSNRKCCQRGGGTRGSYRGPLPWPKYRTVPAHPVPFFIALLRQKGFMASLGKQRLQAKKNCWPGYLFLKSFSSVSAQVYMAANCVGLKCYDKLLCQKRVGKAEACQPWGAACQPREAKGGNGGFWRSRGVKALSAPNKGTC